MLFQGQGPSLDQIHTCILPGNSHLSVLKTDLRWFCLSFSKGRYLTVANTCIILLRSFVWKLQVTTVLHCGVAQGFQGWCDEGCGRSSLGRSFSSPEGARDHNVICRTWCDFVFSITEIWFFWVFDSFANVSHCTTFLIFSILWNDLQLLYCLVGSTQEKANKVSKAHWYICFHGCDLPQTGTFLWLPRWWCIAGLKALASLETSYIKVLLASTKQ